jgi:dTMP kinase
MNYFDQIINKYKRDKDHFKGIMKDYNHSIIISIEGLDGTGKTTQSKLLYDYFKHLEMDTYYLDYPNYKNNSSKLVQMYLHGEIDKNPDNINGYAASTFYAADRYISYKQDWEKLYKETDTLFVSNRYISSNIIHQMCKIDKSRWDEFINWIMDLECKKYGIPEPTKVIYLDLDIETSQNLMNKRYDNDTSKKDIHEENIEYLKRCKESALYAAKKLNWIIIDCNDNGSIKSEQDIFERIILELDDLCLM